MPFRDLDEITIQQIINGSIIYTSITTTHNKIKSHY